MLPPGPALEHLAPTPSSVSESSCLGLDTCAGLYIHTVKLVHGIPIMTSILRPLAGALNLSSSASTPDQDSSDDYPEIGTSACREFVEGGCLILMVAPNGDRLHNIFSRYPTIRRSDPSDAQTPSTGLVQNLNPDFNTMRVQAIMVTIQCMAPDGSPLTVLAQQGAEAVNLIVAKKSVGVSRREPFVGNNDQARHARSEAASSASPNCHLAKHDARQRITQNRAIRDYDRNWDDLCNVIEDRRCLRERTPSPLPRSLAEDVTPVGKSGFRTLAGPLKQF
jgi:hypothetical protein